LDDNSMVRIISGLKEGEQVLLAPPLKNGAVEPGSRLAGIRGADANEMTQQITEKLKAANGPGGGARRRGGAGQGPSAEQMQQQMERLKNLPPEERQKEIERMKQQYQKGAPGGGDLPGPGPGGGRGAGGGRGGRAGGSDQGAGPGKAQ
jgi:hypothetical protein